MFRLIAGRLATGIPTLLAVSMCVFAIVRLIPGDPARLLAGDFATDQIVDELRTRWRLNEPLPVQYAAYLGGVLHGDLGRSIATSTPSSPSSPSASCARWSWRWPPSSWRRPSASARVS